MTDLVSFFLSLSGRANRRDLAVGFFGVFQCGLILQSGSNPSCLARARVIRRGGEVMLVITLYRAQAFSRSWGARESVPVFGVHSRGGCGWRVKSHSSATKC